MLIWTSEKKIWELELFQMNLRTGECYLVANAEADNLVHYLYATAIH